MNNELLEYKKKLGLKCISSYYTFFKTFFEISSNTKLVTNWHIEYICKKLEFVAQDLLNDRIPKYEYFILNMPPGSSKSQLISVLFPVYLWLLRPDLSILSASYSGTLAIDLARKSKQVIDSDLFHELFDEYYRVKFGKTLQFSPDRENDYQNNFGGRRYAVGAGGTILGMHFSLQIVDDLLSAQGSYSNAEIASTNRFFYNTLQTRKKDKEKCKTIIVMQRLNVNDLTGMLLEKEREKVDLLVLPSEKTTNIFPKELETYYKDDLLDVNRLKRETCNSYKNKLGSLSYAGQFLQNPVALEGNLLKTTWFKPKRGIYEGIKNLYIDGAYTKNKNNDPTGLMIASSDKVKLYVKYWASQHLEMPELLKYIKKLYELGLLDERSRIYIEPKASGLSLVQMLKMDGFNAIPIKSKLVNEGKLARANLISPYAESERIELEEADWNDEFISELCSFPTGRHDESIDVLGYAVDIELNGKGSITIYDDINERDSYTVTEKMENLTEKTMLDIAIENGASYVDYLYPD